MKNKILIGILILLFIIPLIFGGFVAYKNVSYQKSLDDEAKIVLNKEQLEMYNYLLTNEDRKDFIQNQQNIKDRTKGEDDEEYLLSDTNSFIDTKKIVDGVYIVYDKEDEKLSKIVKEYYKEENRPNLIIMNKGIEQGFVQYYEVYKNLKRDEKINIDKFPQAFYVRGGVIVKEYKTIKDVDLLPDNTIEKELEEAKKND